jgi:rRNA-processing protein EBP2
MAKTKLKTALAREQGVNFKLERQKKLQKAAEKRKRQKAPKDVEEEEDEDGEEQDVAEGSDLEIDEFDDDGEVKDVSQEEIAAKLAQLLKKANGKAGEWETDDSEADEDEDDEEEGGLALDDESESDSEIEEIPKLVKAKVATRRNGAAQDNDDEDEDEDEDDIPLSDIESLASEDRADVVPHQRLTINNTAALQRSLKSFALPATLPFSAVQSVTSENPIAIADVEDDLNRELAFYRQSLDAVTEARRRLKKEGVPFTRPTDYFAEMVKSEEQMGKVRTKMLDAAARTKASADARRQRDLKKFGKAVQVAKLQERQKEKRETLDRISTLKRSEYRCYDFFTCMAKC